MPAEISEPWALPWGGKCEHLATEVRHLGTSVCFVIRMAIVSCFVYGVVLTADCAILFFFNGRATLNLTWEVHCFVLVRVSAGIITTESPEKQT